MLIAAIENLGGVDNPTLARRSFPGLWEEEVPSHRYRRDPPGFRVCQEEPCHMQNVTFSIIPLDDLDWLKGERPGGDLSWSMGACPSGDLDCSKGKYPP